MVTFFCSEFVFCDDVPISDMSIVVINLKQVNLIIDDDSIQFLIISFKHE